MKRTCRQLGFTWIETIIVGVILVVLLGFAIPAAFRVRLQGAQMKDLNSGKQVYLGLKLFATDNEGRFPWADYDSDIGGPAISGTRITNANTAFQNICPQYVPARGMFYVAHSAWTPVLPDETASALPLSQPGENAYAYVPGLTVSSNASFPLIADAFSPQVGVYSHIAGEKGGVWKGKSALVIRVDGSTRFEKCDPKTLRVSGTGNQLDLFAPARNWIPQAPVNPL